MERVPYAEFGYFADNAAEFGLPYDGPPAVRREFVEVRPGCRLSALVAGDAGAGAAPAGRARRRPPPARPPGGGGHQRLRPRPRELRRLRRDPGPDHRPQPHPVGVVAAAGDPPQRRPARRRQLGVALRPPPRRGPGGRAARRRPRPLRGPVGGGVDPHRAAHAGPGDGRRLGGERRRREGAPRPPARRPGGARRGRRPQRPGRPARRAGRAHPQLYPLTPVRRSEPHARAEIEVEARGQAGCAPADGRRVNLISKADGRRRPPTYPGSTGMDGGGWKNRPLRPIPVPREGGWLPTTGFVPTVTSTSRLPPSTPAPTTPPLSPRPAETEAPIRCISSGGCWFGAG